jgi:hypothetical protein
MSESSDRALTPNAVWSIPGERKYNDLAMRAHNGLLRLAGALALCTSGLAPQELSTEILQMHRAKVHLADEVMRLPNYTCLETVARFHREPLQRRFMPLDTVRLEIVYSERQEWFGSPGERRLTTKNPIRFVGSGMIGTGVFGILVSNIASGAVVNSHGEEIINGRRTLRYAFRLPQLLKPMRIELAEGAGIVGEEGSLWVDALSLDLVHLEANATEIPIFLPLRVATSTVSYALVQLGGESAVLPEHATLYILESSGVEEYDRLDFTHCRTFSAQSDLRFDTTEETSTGASEARSPHAASDAVPGAVPPFLPVAVRLATPITDHDAVGTLIQGKVTGEVRHKGRVLIPDGAVVHGRIRRLERRGETRDFIVGLEFTEVETAEGRMRFLADFLKMDKNRMISELRFERVFVRNEHGALEGQSVTVTLPELPGVASFFIRGERFTIPAGFKMLWRTRGVIRQ